MAEQAGPPATRVISVAKILRWCLMGLVVSLAIVAVILPSDMLSWLRSDYYPWFGRPLNWLDRASFGQLDLTHVAMFGGISLLASSLWPRTPWWRIALLLLALATGTELLQFWVPGREPRLSDLSDDLIGTATGLLLALLFRWLTRLSRSSRWGKF